MSKPVTPNPRPPYREADSDEWVECWNCGGEGEIEDEDWQFAGDFYCCDICDGHGGWRRIPGPRSVAIEEDPGMG